MQTIPKVNLVAFFSVACPTVTVIGLMVGVKSYYLLPLQFILLIVVFIKRQQSKKGHSISPREQGCAICGCDLGDIKIQFDDISVCPECKGRFVQMIKEGIEDEEVQFRKEGNSGTCGANE